MVLILSLKYIKKMFNLFHFGHYYYYIFNAATATIEWMSEEVKDVLGVSEPITAEYIF